MKVVHEKNQNLKIKKCLRIYALRKKVVNLTKLFN